VIASTTQNITGRKIKELVDGVLVRTPTIKPGFIGKF
jgi:hypothetical protein